MLRSSARGSADMLVSLGFHATTSFEYAAAFQKVFSMPSDETVAMRRRAQKSARRFSEDVFARGWIAHVDRLVESASLH